MITIDLLSSFRLTYDGRPVVLQHRQILLIQALWCAGGPLPAGGQYPDESTALRLLAVAWYRCERMRDAAAVCRRAIDNLRAAGHDATLFQELQRAIVTRAMPLRGALVS